MIIFEILPRGVAADIRRAGAGPLDGVNLKRGTQPRRLQSDRTAARADIPHHAGMQAQFGENDCAHLRMRNHIAVMHIRRIIQSQRQFRRMGRWKQHENRKRTVRARVIGKRP